MTGQNTQLSEFKKPVELPFNYKLEKAFQEKSNQILEQEKREYELRKIKNAENAKVQTLKRISEYKLHFSEIEAKKQEALKNNSVYLPKEPEFFLILRIRGLNRVPPKPRKALDLLKLRKPNTAVLMPNNQSIRAQLQIVRNYVAYGTVDLFTLRELIYKRGLTTKRYFDDFGVLQKKVMNISNENIQDFFGDLCCLEDIVYHIYFGQRFSEMNRFLNPFKLNSPKGGFKGKKAKDVFEGGSCGNWYDQIDTLVKKMIN